MNFADRLPRDPRPAAYAQGPDDYGLTFPARTNHKSAPRTAHLDAGNVVADHVRLNAALDRAEYLLAKHPQGTASPLPPQSFFALLHRDAETEQAAIAAAASAAQLETEAAQASHSLKRPWSAVHAQRYADDTYDGARKACAYHRA